MLKSEVYCENALFKLSSTKHIDVRSFIHDFSILRCILASINRVNRYCLWLTPAHRCCKRCTDCSLVVIITMNHIVKSSLKFSARGNTLLRGSPAMGGARLLNVHEYVRSKSIIKNEPFRSFFLYL